METSLSIRAATLPTAQLEISRDQYGALVIRRTAGAIRTRFARTLRDVEHVLVDLQKGNTDEHRAPAWETGAAFDRHGAGEAVNISLYGIDRVDGQPLGVVQVRQWHKRRSWQYAQVRKNYFLVGRNEGTGLPFAHSIESRVVHAAVARDPSPESPVTAARAWIFDVSADKLPYVLRHGDVAAIPVRALPRGERRVIAEASAGTRVIDSHVLQAEEIVDIGGNLYARNPLLQHLRGQHADVSGAGWYRIQVGLRRPLAVCETDSRLASNIQQSTLVVPTGNQHGSSKLVGHKEILE